MDPAAATAEGSPPSSDAAASVGPPSVSPSTVSPSAVGSSAAGVRTPVVAPAIARAPGAAPPSAAQGATASSSPASPSPDVQGPSPQGAGAKTAASAGALGQGAAAAQSGPSETSAPSSSPSPTPSLDALFAVLPQAPTPGLAPSVAAEPPAAGAATVADLASQTVARVGSGASQFQITLTPEGLGQVSVTVNVGAEGKVSAAFAFEKPETADALSGRAMDLQKALEQAGFSVSEAGLSFAVATPATHGQGAGADQTPGGALGQGAGQNPGGQGSPGQGSSGQGGSSQGDSSQGAAYAQTGTAGSGSGDSGAQSRSWTYGQAAGRAFATASDAAAAVDQSPNSPYASRAASGLDIRI